MITSLIYSNYNVQINQISANITFIQSKLFFLSSLLFLFGLIIILLNYKNLLISLLGIDIILLSAKIIFLADYICFGTASSLIIIFVVLTISAIENAVGITFFILSFSLRKKFGLEKTLLEKDGFF